MPLQGARGEGDDQLWVVDVVPLLGAIAGCYRVAIVVCYGWGGGLGECKWCHCRVRL